MNNHSKLAFTLIAFSIFILGIAAVISFKIIPASTQVYLAGIAGCEISNEELAEGDPEFEGIKWWEPYISHAYRIKQMNMGGSFVINDSFSENESVYHLLLTASDSTKEICDKEIISLVQNYGKLGANINHYNDRGFTPLHEAVIMKNIPLIATFLELGADRGLEVKNPSYKISGMNTNEMIEFFINRNPENWAKNTDRHINKDLV